MGDNLQVITYHELGMGSPEDLCDGGIAYRAEIWYEFAMGGAAANGADVGNINTVGVQNLSADPILQTADFEITWEVHSTDPRSSDITVKVTAKQDFPANTNLHFMVLQTRIDWEDEYDFKPSNGQTYMINGVRDLCTDSMGVELPELKNGESHSVTKTYTANPKMIYPDRLRTAALVQVMDTKKILAVTETDKSPLDTGSIPIIAGKYVHKKTALHLASIGSHMLGMTLPFNNTTALVYNTAGRVLAKQSFSGMEGQRATLLLPEAQGILFLRLVSESGRSVTVKIPYNK
jgi:hypothetical protein